jgi:hypothetical protein
MTEGPVPSELRRLIIERARNRCEYCQYPGLYSSQAFSIDHIVPRRDGGATREDNLALSCQGCNSHKAARTSAIDPVTRSIVSLFDPRSELWRDHFVWSEDFLIVIGLTACGRATIDALQLNREGLLNMRRVLYGVGEHPPPQDES